MLTLKAPWEVVVRVRGFVTPRLCLPVARVAAYSLALRYKMAPPFTAALDLEAGVCAGLSLG